MTSISPSNQPVDWNSVALEVRESCQLPDGRGPDDLHIIAGVRGFTEAFDYWYARVVRNAVSKYRAVVIQRINPFIRRIQLDSLDSQQAAQRLVDDWDSRNYVTAGGWAFEALASDGSKDAQKSAATGIDLQRYDPETGDVYLYVLKSGTVTRNSDIVKELKRNSRQAEKLLKQGRSTGTVHANWAIAAGKTSSTFEDGVRRPSSGEFWGEMFDLEEDEAVPLTLAMVAAAGKLIRNDVDDHLRAMRVLVADYIAQRDDADQVDWEFIARRTLEVRTRWSAEDQQRHSRALVTLTDTGYKMPTPETTVDT